MSATYNCNWCGKKMHKHVRSYHSCAHVSRKLHNNPNEADVKVSVDVETTDGNLDLCKECMNDIKKEAFRKKINLC